MSSENPWLKLGSKAGAEDVEPNFERPPDAEAPAAPPPPGGNPWIGLTRPAEDPGNDSGQNPEASPEAPNEPGPDELDAIEGSDFAVAAE